MAYNIEFSWFSSFFIAVAVGFLVAFCHPPRTQFDIRQMCRCVEKSRNAKRRTKEFILLWNDANDDGKMTIWSCWQSCWCGWKWREFVVGVAHSLMNFHFEKILVFLCLSVRWVLLFIWNAVAIKRQTKAKIHS